MEITGAKGYVLVNGKIYQQDSKVILIGGDEVVFGSSGKHAYVSFLLKYLAFMTYLLHLWWTRASIFLCTFFLFIVFLTTLPSFMFNGFLDSGSDFHAAD